MQVAISTVGGGVEVGKSSKKAKTKRAGSGGGAGCVWHTAYWQCVCRWVLVRVSSSGGCEVVVEVVGVGVGFS